MSEAISDKDKDFWSKAILQEHERKSPSELDRVTAERDALQQRLTTSDERNDTAIDILLRTRAVIEGLGYADLERDIAAFLKPSTVEPTFCNCNQGRLPCTCKGAQAEPTAADKIEGMVPTYDGQYAVMIDPKNGHYGWVFYKHADGGWVSSRKATEAEMSAARAQARINSQQ